MPTAAQVRQLPELARVLVPAEWEDMNGHVNVQHHLGMYNQTSDALLEMLGISECWVRSERVGLVDLEHHIWFRHELHVGDQVALHLRFTARSAKRVQGVCFLLDETDDALASAIEFLSTTIDLDARRVIELPEVIAARIDALIQAQQALPWPAPCSESMSV